MVKKQSVQLVVSKLRSLAQLMKDHKSTSSATVFKVVDSGKEVATFYVSLCKNVAQCLSSATAICNEVVGNADLRAHAVTIIENGVVDAANRVNEFANLVEAASKNEAVCDAVEDIVEALNDLDAAASKTKTETETPPVVH